MTENDEKLTRICRKLKPIYEDWEVVNQQAFRELMEFVKTLKKGDNYNGA